MATTRLPRLCRAARVLATARIFAGVSRQVPPYFCTMMGLVRILLTEIPCTSPARQPDQPTTGTIARPLSGRQSGSKAPMAEGPGLAKWTTNGKSQSDRERDDRAAEGGLALRGHPERQPL